MGNKSVKLLDVAEEWRDAQTRFKELQLSASCDIQMRDHGPAKKVAVVYPQKGHNQWLRMELGPFCWDLLDYTAPRDGTEQSPQIALTTGSAFFQLDSWLRLHGCL